MNYSIPCLASITILLANSTYLTVSKDWPSLLIFMIVAISLAMMWSVYLIVQSHCRSKYFKYTNNKSQIFKTVYLCPTVIGLGCLLTFVLCFSLSETAYDSWRTICASIGFPLIVFTLLITWFYYEMIKKRLHFVILDELKKSKCINSLEWFLSHETSEEGAEQTILVCRCSDLSINHFVQLLKAGLVRQDYRFRSGIGDYHTMYIKKNKGKSLWKKMSIVQTDNDNEFRICIE